MIDGWIVVVEDSKICSRLQPEVIRQTGMQTGRRKILLAVRSHRQERVVDIRGIRAAMDVRPVMIFHQDDENRLDGWQRISKSNTAEHQREKKNTTPLHKVVYARSQHR